MNYKELIEKLNKWNEEYYNGTPTVEDSVFDMYLRQLKDFEEAHPELISMDSPTQKVGTTSNIKFSKVAHDKPMLSLDNVFTDEDIARFISNLESTDTLIAQPKIDGISASIKYANGKLVQAVTRGDGEIGEDITENVLQLTNVPHTIKTTAPIEVRGEVYISYSNFEKLDGFANPRNTVAGTMRQKDAKVVKERNISFVAYYLDGSNATDEFTKLSLLHSLGFETPTYVILPEVSVETVNGAIKTIDSYSLHYETDGVVFKVDKCERQAQLGFTSKFPKWATAYKFPAKEAETTLKRIFATVGRTGKITYNAELEPIHIDGSTVTFASLHNANYIQDLDLRVGAKVGVIKAGEIIPKVTRSIEAPVDSVAWEKHTQCPSCADDLVEIDGKVDQFCTNPTCKDKIKAQLSFFASKEAMNIVGLSDSTIEKLIQENLIVNATDIFNLTENDLSKLESFKEKSIQNLLSSIEQARNARLDKVINSIGISGIGKNSSKAIAKQISKISELLNFDTIDNLNELGDVQKSNLKEFVSIESNINFINELENMLNVEQVKKVEQKGITVVITGSFDSMKRPQVKDMLEELGFKVSSSVSGNTDYLICGEKPSASKTSKIDQSKIINEPVVENLRNWAQNIG